MKLKVNEPIPLSKQVPDLDATKVVKAILKDDQGNDLAESPVTLTNVGDAMHQDFSVNYPQVPFVQVSYPIFLANGTTPSGDELTGEIFVREFVSALSKPVMGIIDRGVEGQNSPKITITRGSDALVSIKYLIEELGDAFFLGDVTQITFSFRDQLDQPLDIVLIGTAAVAEISEITTVADAGSNLDRKTFILNDQNGTVAFWFDVGDTGSQIPTLASSADRAFKISAVNPNDTADDVAIAVNAAIDFDGEFGSSVASNVVTVTDAVAGARTDIIAGDSGFTVDVLTQGVTLIPAQVEVDGAREGVANGTLTDLQTNALRLGFDQDIKTIIDKGSERTVIVLRNVLRVVD